MGEFVIYNGTKTVPIIIDKQACTQVRRAAGDLRQDIAMITGALSYAKISRTFIDNFEIQTEQLNNADKNKTPELQNSGNGGTQKLALRVGSYEDVFKFGTFSYIDKWYQLIVTINSNKVATIYYDGKKYSTVLQNGVKELKGKDNFIGTSGYNGHQSIKGYIADFKIYSTALTENEVNELLSEGKPEECDELISYAEPSLGVDENNEFYIKYKVDFNDAVKSTPDDIGCHVAVYYLSSDGFTKHISDQVVTVDENGIATVGIRPKDTNVTYKLTAFTTVSAKNDRYTTETIGSKETSVYEEVVKELANGGYRADSKMNQTLVSKANEIIAKGGVLSNTALDDVRSKIMTAAADGKTITVSIKEPFGALGIGFLSSLYVGSETEVNEVVGEAGVVYDTLTINTDLKTAVLSNSAAAQKLEVSYPEAIQLELVQK